MRGGETEKVDTQVFERVGAQMTVMTWFGNRPRAIGRPLATLGIALLAGLLVAACGSSPSGSSGNGSGSGSGSGTPTPASSPPSSSGGSSQYLSVDSASKSVTLTLNITGFNFDGFSQGQMTVNIPQGWSVTVQCNNKSTIPHSCAIVQNTSSTTPAFSGASTTDPTTGLQPNSSGMFTFTPGSTGQYLIGCLVPGHMSAGMWDHFDVTSSGSPSVST